MILYFLEVALAWTLFYLLYSVFLKNQTFFNINRWYLLSTLWIGAMIPFLKKLQLNLEPQQSIVSEPIIFINGSTSYIADSVHMQSQASSFDYGSLIWYVYLTGVLFCFVKMLIGLIKIRRIYKAADKENEAGLTIAVSKDYHAPFSFLNTIFLHESEFQKESIKEILEHERKHVRSKHSYDVLLVEILSILFWWIPTIYFYKHAIKEVHEFVADASAVQHSNIKKYGLMLLGHSSSGNELALSNQFFNSHLKKRIIMLCKEKSSKYQLCRYLLIVPSLFFLVVLFSFKSETIEDRVSDLSNQLIEEIELLDLPSFSLDFKTRPMKITKGINPKKKYPNSYQADTPHNSVVSYDHESSLLSKPDCAALKDRPDVFYISDYGPRFSECVIPGSMACPDSCTRANLCQIIKSDLEYTEEAIRQGYEGFVFFQLIIDEQGRIAEINEGKNSNNSFGIFESIVDIVNKSNIKLEPGMCDGSPVKTAVNLGFKMELSPEHYSQIQPRLESNTPKTNQKITLNYATDKMMGFFATTNLSTPVKVKIINPNGELILSEDFNYVYRATQGSVKLEDPTNGTYTAIMTQDGKEFKTSMPVTIF